LPYSVETVTTEEGLSRLEDAWNRLNQSAMQPNVFMSYDWYRAWNRRLSERHGGDRRPHVLVLKNGGEIAGLLPLVYHTASRYGLTARKLEFAETFGDYHELVLGNDLEGMTRAIAEYLMDTRDEWDVVELRDLREAGNTPAAINRALSGTGLVYRLLPEPVRCPYMPIVGSADSMVTSETRRAEGCRTFRKERQRLKRLTEEGLRVRIIEDPQREPGLVEKLIALEGQKHVGGELSAPFIAEHPHIFQQLFDTLGPRGWFAIGYMEQGDRPVGVRLVFRCGTKLWEFLTAYDHSFARWSPGIMLVLALLDYGFDHGCDEFDFLRGEESYKKEWSSDVHQSRRLLIWNPRWASRARAWVYFDVKPLVYSLFGKAE